MTELVQARVDKKIKNKATKIFHSLGLDMSTGIKIYLNKVVSEQGVPFQLLTENGFTVEQEQSLLDSIAEMRADYKSGRLKPAKNFRELQKELLA
ncbi:MAG: type II toxin-antitoxin system RelB/DinJ family antitoxin [Patescibacteria group bacterium]